MNRRRLRDEEDEQEEEEIMERNNSAKRTTIESVLTEESRSNMNAKKLNELLKLPVPETNRLDLAYFYRMAYTVTASTIAQGLSHEDIDVSNATHLRNAERKVLILIDRIKEHTMKYKERLRIYNMRAAHGKWARCTSAVLVIFNLVIILDHIRKYQRAGSSSNSSGSMNAVNAHIKENDNELREWMIENELILFNKPFHTYTQMELYQQLQVLGGRWHELHGCYSKLQDLVDILELRAAWIVVGRHPEKVMDGKLGEHKLVAREAAISNTSQLFSCSLLFVDNLSCILEDFYLSFSIRKKLDSYCTVTTDTDAVIEDYCCNQLGPSVQVQSDHATVLKGMRVWLEREASDVADDKFKDMLRAKSVNVSLRAGELQVYMRDNGGVKPNSGVAVIETTRPPTQVTWWVTKSIQRSLGITLNDQLPLVKNVITCMLFHTFCESELRFPWANKCMVLEKDFNEREIVFRSSGEHSPVIIQCIGSYHVYMNNVLYETHTLEDAIIMWLILVERECDNEYASVLETWNLEAATNLIRVWADPSRSGKLCSAYSDAMDMDPTVYAEIETQ
jgi:hypothetical protein